MTKPRTVVEIAFNAGYTTAASSRTWTDVTGYVFAQNSIDITHACQDEFSQPGPNTCRLTLDNRDGRFTPGLSSGAYYPNVKVGRPLRVSVQMCPHGDFGTFEADATGWSGSNATVSRSTLQAHSGSAALLVTASSAGDMFAFCPAAMSAIPVAPSETYRASAWFRRAGTARTTDLRVVWFDSVGNTISTSTSSTITDSTTWQQITFDVTAPSNAAFAQIRPFWASANEGHYVDDIFFGCDRFTGYIDEWPLEWPHTVSTYATTTISASSRMAREGLAAKVRSVVEQEILRDSPIGYYTMSEAEGATQANDSSGNSFAALTRPGWGGAAPTFGVDTGPTTDGLTAVRFAGESRLAAQFSQVTIVAIEFFLAATATGGASGSANLVTLLNGSTGLPTLEVDVDLSTGILTASFWPSYPSVGQSVSTSASVLGGTVRHLFIGDGDVYVNGALDASSTAYIGVNTASLILGSNVAGVASADFAHVALYDGSVAAGRIADHSSAGASGFSAEIAVDRLARYATYAGTPPAEYSFSTAAATPMAHIDTTGKGTVELMQTVATTDGGVLYDGRNGVLTYVDRAVRYNADARADLYVSDGDVEVGYSPKVDRSALTNKLTATLSDGTYSVTAENTTSTTEYGAHGPGDLELATTSQDEAHAAAWWRVNTYGEPSARVPQVGVELAKLTAARQAEILAVDVSDKITVNDLPSQSDASAKSFFVEGCTETITATQHFITFNVSPTTGFDVWEIDHATFGQYDAYPLSY